MLVMCLLFFMLKMNPFFGKKLLSYRYPVPVAKQW